MKLVLAVAVTLLVGAAPAAKQKTKAVDARAADAEIKKLLDAQQQHISDCVTTEAPQGAWSLTVNGRLQINSQGQLLSAVISFSPERGEPTRACIEGVLKAVAWPKSPAALTTVTREWKFAVK